MKLAFRTIGSIAVPLIPIFLYYRHSTPALICLCVAIVCFITWAILDRNSEKRKIKPNKPIGVGHDENAGEIIKAISEETNGFATVSDIVRDTNLPIKRINKTLDWLLMNNFAIQRKGRNGKVYILTPEGRSVFSQLINENINLKNKNQALIDENQTLNLKYNEIKTAIEVYLKLKK